MPNLVRRRFSGYMVALGMTALALCLRWMFDSVFGPGFVFITFYPAVVITGMLCGGRAGILATVLSAIIGDILFLQPRGSLITVTTGDAVALGFFVISGILISLMGNKMEEMRRRKWELAEQAKREPMLRQSEERYRSLFEHMLDGSAYCRLLYENGRPSDFLYLEVNESFKRLTGLKDVVGKKVSEVIPGIHQTNPELLEIYSRVAQTARSEKFETCVKSLGIWFSVAVYSPRKDHFVAVFDNVTERKNAYEALQRNESLLRAITDNSPDPIFMKDCHCRMLLANPATLKALHRRPEDVLGKTDDQFYDDPGEGRRKMDNDRRVMESGQAEIFEEPVPTPDGLRTFLSVKTPYRDAQGAIIGVIGVAHDITDRKRIEEDRMILSKLESTGILAGGIAHDYNNLLNAFLLNLDLAESDAAAGRNVLPCLQRLRDLTTTAFTLTKQFLPLAGGGGPARKPALIPQLVAEAVSVALGGSNIRCQIPTPQTPCWAEVDEGQIGQVLRNLLLNARDAAPNGGNVRLTVSEVVLQPANLLNLSPGRYIQVQVADDGTGIPPEVLPKIFDPYFSTKQRGTKKGMGLGLTVCHSVIQKHGGKITVESKVGQGTTFTFYLPACPAPPQTLGKTEAQHKPSTSASKRILLMDDEQIMRFAIKAVLKRKGYDVTVAQNGEEAMEFYTSAKSHGRRFDAVILDLTIRGGMGGRDTMQELLKIDPDVRGIVMTGYSEDPVLLQPERYGFKAGLEKSFDAELLDKIIRQVTTEGGTH